ncbi:predicted protein [Sclerotinia sclerotiorum 1980 UF-70]|uniref:Uncharacterized protein n=1 Tax=Sclerotinia sclerotiorum (strain ATCC 18683 / 1980 / Ss-1) TaxID=665079 RepID=A7E8U3_SCLS1|nr:predicted protein [Sclerotinia sclerotiorum 1980 UF-70]EDN96795.1 predicted protein [Sclerotinia sclerotiorum 1980 UF-70]
MGIWIIEGYDRTGWMGDREAEYDISYKPPVSITHLYSHCYCWYEKDTEDVAPTDYVGPLMEMCWDEMKLVDGRGLGGRRLEMECEEVRR